MTPNDFIAKWRNGGDERRDFQSFFDDLCRLLGHQTPREADPDHTWFTYEYGASKTSGGQGWADAWKKGYFGFEAKGTGKDLTKAYAQLKMYADALENPPLLIVSDLQRFEIHTNFTATVKQVHRFTVQDLADHETRRLLVAAFNDPHQLRPGTTREDITKAAAGKFATLADALRTRGNEPHAVAHFLNRLLFCMFAEDIGLLPDHIFSKLVRSVQDKPDQFESRAAALFMAMKDGGDFALNSIQWFNGGLFEDNSTLTLEPPELVTLLEAAALDWSEIDPSIFGTLFERGLDPKKRSQLGAHYTDPATIMKLLRPLVVEPWLAEWEAEKLFIAPLVERADIYGKTQQFSKKAAQTKAQNEANQRLWNFLERLRAFRVLDPACGSGNFLFMALKALKDFEQRVIIEGELMGLTRHFPTIGPVNVLGIELNEYAAELARISVWIGEIQWMVQNGHGVRRDPILQALGGIENRDALVNLDGTEAVWPVADVIVGNPPFIGDKKMKRELGKDYAGRVRKAYAGRVPGSADFVCYWFEKANDAIRSGASSRAGLVATNSIRNGASRKVLEHAVEATRIFEAWSDEPWTNEGASVRVSLVCFGHSTQEAKLDGEPVAEIFTDLRGAAFGAKTIDLTKAKPLRENDNASFFGYCLAGPFTVDAKTARQWLSLPNPHGAPNSDVLTPIWNGNDVKTRPADRWAVDFGTNKTAEEAAMYEAPFAHVAEIVKPKRDENERESRAKRWWLYGETRPGMRREGAGLPRWIATIETAKHRYFVWVPSGVAPEHKLVVFPRADDTTFGLLSSYIHILWVLRSGSTLEDRPVYTTGEGFGRFPFPDGLTPADTAHKRIEELESGAIIPAELSSLVRANAATIAVAAAALVGARERWLNPPEWTYRVPEVVAGYPDRILAKPGHEAELKKRTLTNLYNARPAWLANLHRDLDVSVAAAYGWEWPIADDELLRRLFELNQSRAVAPT